MLNGVRGRQVVPVCLSVKVKVKVFTMNSLKIHKNLYQVSTNYPEKFQASERKRKVSSILENHKYQSPRRTGDQGLCTPAFTLLILHTYVYISARHKILVKPCLHFTKICFMMQDSTRFVDVMLIDDFFESGSLAQRQREVP